MALALTPAPVFWSQNKHQLSSYDEPQLDVHVYAFILKNQYNILIVWEKTLFQAVFHMIALQLAFWIVKKKNQIYRSP